MRWEAKERLIVALDVDDFAKAKELVERLKDQVTTFKVGIQLFTTFGPKAVEMIQQYGGKVFLDLKFHDIPSVVAQAVREGVRLRAFMLTLHAFGGQAMLQEAVTAAREEANRLSVEPPLLLAVTVLT
ncbi:MAG: orotidine 5'-phosphate decarboxylase / HUMPS family protein, partial [Candidatus Methylomirabilales bacterium]